MYYSIIVITSDKYILSIVISLEREKMENLRSTRAIRRDDVWQAADALHVPDATIAAEQFLLLAMRGNRRLTDTLAWDEDEARQHAQDVVLLFYR